MNNEEPVRAITENNSVSTEGSPLPEQAKIPTVSMPRQISFLNLINQWQPMGYRVVLNLPFVGNDSDFLFFIRSGPFIPPPPRFRRYLDDYYDSNPEIYKKQLGSYANNNMAPVFLFASEAREYPDWDDKDKKDFPITLTQYDMPPPIATMANSFRRWRGDMEYRIRVVAGFATQGYIVVTPLKNVFVPVGVYDQFKIQPAIQRQDQSYRPSMLNAYGLADTSMYRHIEVTMPYDYPTPYYDQFAWMARRSTPAPYFLPYNGTGKEPPNPVQRSSGIKAEPHGDNFIAVGLRGNLAATQAGSQIEFELEYRCSEGFQFSDPFLPPRDTVWSSYEAKQRHAIPHVVPSRDWTSDGMGLPIPTDPSLALSIDGMTIHANTMKKIKSLDPVQGRLLGHSSRIG